jgi:fatty-acyl-CoA synthase
VTIEATATCGSPIARRTSSSPAASGSAASRSRTRSWAHPAVAEAAVFAGRHDKWGERPIAAIVYKPGKTATNDELAAHLGEQFPKYWLPDLYVAIEQVPRNSTGKFLKTKLRDTYGDALLTKGSGG